MKNIRVFFLSETIQFLEVKFSIYLNRRVFVMSLEIAIITDRRLPPIPRERANKYEHSQLERITIISPLYTDIRYNDKIRYNDN